MTQDVIIIPADSRYPLRKQPLITNEMKAECMGEFSFTLNDGVCSKCYDAESPDKDCVLCGGEIELIREIVIPWDTMKGIYKKMAVVAALTPS